MSGKKARLSRFHAQKSTMPLHAALKPVMPDITKEDDIHLLRSIIVPLDHIGEILRSACQCHL